MQIITIAGTIGKDAVTRTTGSGDNVASFSVAVDNGKDKSGNRRDATWYDCSLWGKRGDALCQYIQKGGKVTVTGRPTVRVHKDKAYQGIRVNEIALQGRGQGDTQRQNTRGDYQSDQRQAPAQDFDLDDEIPF